MSFVAIKMSGRQGGPSRTGGRGPYLKRDVTDEQRSRRAAASWPFFRLARSLRINSGMLVVAASPARTALKNSQLTCGERRAISGTGH
jgi:hypothetical protein